ncbi:MmgE/PrpD family protein [Novosphingobium resinovorum]|uniref:MmgE/PrpD family protein n=1 Tax=Novosphingobium resinovorum TaxID=158500 RepID=UPI002ED68CAC|nr:MmgE/PrpD family protein [Novosphingobium resinovorum]
MIRWQSLWQFIFALYRRFENNNDKFIEPSNLRSPFWRMEESGIVFSASGGRVAQIEEQFVAQALNTRWQDFDRATQSAACALVFDSLAVGVAGYCAAHAAQVSAAVAGWGGACGSGGDARGFILGGATGGWSPAQAAFVNAFQIHAQEFDCVHEPAVAHPMATVCAALLAEAARAPVHGADFLAAVIAGIEVVATLGVAARTGPRFFRPALAGVFGSALALARLRKVPRATARAALGHALSFASGTMQAHVEGKPTLALQVAHAARSAVEACDLACAGIPAPDDAISGPFGYLALFEDETDIRSALAQTDRAWRVTEVSIKPFPTGRAAHGGLTALREAMVDHGLSAENLVRFTYRAPPLIARLVGRPAKPDMTVAYARLCFAWLAALQLTQGRVALSAFTQERLSDPVLLALAQRFAIEDDGTADPAAFGPGEAIVECRDGRSIVIGVSRQPGAPDYPLDEAELLDKAAECLAFGGLAQDRGTREGDAHAAAKALHEAVLAIPGQRDVVATLKPLLTVRR